MKWYERVVCRNITQMRPTKHWKDEKGNLVFHREPIGRGWLTLEYGRDYSVKCRDKDRPITLCLCSNSGGGSTPLGGIVCQECLWHVRVDDLKTEFPKRKKDETLLAWAQRSAKRIKRKFPFKFTQDVSESIPRESFQTATESLESGLTDWVMYTATSEE